MNLKTVSFKLIIQIEFIFYKSYIENSFFFSEIKPTEEAIFVNVFSNFGQIIYAKPWLKFCIGKYYWSVMGPTYDNQKCFAFQYHSKTSVMINLSVDVYSCKKNKYIELLNSDVQFNPGDFKTFCTAWNDSALLLNNATDTWTFKISVKLLSIC